MQCDITRVITYMQHICLHPTLQRPGLAGRGLRASALPAGVGEEVRWASIGTCEGGGDDGPGCAAQPCGRSRGSLPGPGGGVSTLPSHPPTPPPKGGPPVGPFFPKTRFIWGPQKMGGGGGGGSDRTSRAAPGTFGGEAQCVGCEWRSLHTMALKVAYITITWHVFLNPLSCTTPRLRGRYALTFLLPRK